MHLHFQRRHPSKRVVLPSMVLFIDAAWTIPGLFHDVRLLTYVNVSNSLSLG